LRGGNQKNGCGAWPKQISLLREAALFLQKTEIMPKRGRASGRVKDRTRRGSPGRGAGFFFCRNSAFWNAKGEKMKEIAVEKEGDLGLGHQGNNRVGGRAGSTGILSGRRK